jgi:hypothetical protein
MNRAATAASAFRYQKAKTLQTDAAIWTATGLAMEFLPPMTRLPTGNCAAGDRGFFAE